MDALHQELEPDTWQQVYQHYQTLLNENRPDCNLSTADVKQNIDSISLLDNISDIKQKSSSAAYFIPSETKLSRKADQKRERIGINFNKYQKSRKG